MHGGAQTAPVGKMIGPRKPAPGVYEVLSEQDLLAGGIGLLTHSRATAGWYRNSSGLLVQAGVDVSRIEYDADGNLLGLLREVASQNEALHSEDWSNAAVWGQVDSIAANDAVAPDGLTTADKITELTAGQNMFVQAVTVTVDAGSTWTQSIWMKLTGSGEGSGVVQLVMARIAPAAYQEFQNEVTLTSSWQRVPVTGTWTDAHPGINFIARTVAGGVTEVHVWGAQLEEQAYATSYIPTGASAVARAEDFVTSDLSWLPQPIDGVLEWTGRAHETASGDQVIYEMHDGTANEAIQVKLDSSGNVVATITTGGAPVTLTSPSTVASNTQFTVRLQVAPFNFALIVDAQAIQTDTSADVPTGLDDMEMGEARAGGDSISNHDKALTYAHGARIA